LGVRLPDPATEAGANSPALLAPVLGTEAQARILAEMFVDPHPVSTFLVRDLADWTHVHQPTAHRVIQELGEAGWVTVFNVEDDQYARVAGQPKRHALGELINATYGPKPFLERALAQVPGIAEAYLIGSWAARYRGVRGRPPGDIDVMLIGDFDQFAVHDIANDLERRAHTSVDLHIRKQHAWDHATDSFVQTVQERPLVGLLPTTVSTALRAAQDEPPDGGASHDG
jgi:hypothetical protein